MNTSNQQGILVVDFDRTVFDSDALYLDLYKLCEARGISRDFLDPALALVPPDNLLFNFFLMVQRSQQIEPDKIEKVVAEMQSYVREKGHLYIFDDSRKFLGAAIKANWNVIILTYGDIYFQLAKFIGSGLGSLCTSFIVTSKVKWSHLEIFKTSSVIFIDDNPKNIDEIKEKFPDIVAVEVKRKGTKYQCVLSRKANFLVNQLSWPLEFQGGRMSIFQNFCPLSLFFSEFLL